MCLAVLLRTRSGFGVVQQIQILSAAVVLKQTSKQKSNKS